VITPTLQTAVTQFLSYFLQPLRKTSGGGPLTPAELAHFVGQLGEELEITIGEYRPYLGAVPECAGQSFPAEFALNVSRTPASITREGSSGISVAHEPSPKRPFPHKYVIRWLVERADIRVDGRETLGRVLRDLRPPSTWSPAGPSASQPSPPGSGYGEKVADAVAAIEDRALFPRRLSEVESVPSGLDATIEEFRQILGRFFTFSTEGDYYAKWWTDGEGQFPEETTEQYRRRNIETPDLQGDDLHVIGNVPSNFGFPDNPNHKAGEFREFVARLDTSSGDPSRLGIVLINSATKTVEIGGSPARDLFDFCFFTIQSSATG